LVEEEILLRKNGNENKSMLNQKEGHSSAVIYSEQRTNLRTLMRDF